MLTTAITYALITMVSFGVANAASKELSQTFGAVRATVLRSLLVAVLLAATLAVLRTPIILNWSWIGIGVGIGFLGYLGFLLFMLALKTGKVGVVVPVASSSIIVSSLFGFLLLGDTFGITKLATVLLATAGVVVATLRFQDIRHSDLFSLHSGVPYALLCALVWGVAFPLYKFPSDELGALFYALIVEIVVLVSACVQIYATPWLETDNSFSQLTTKPSGRLLVYIVVGTIGTAIGAVFLNFAYQTGEVSIVSAIYGANSIVSLFAGWFFYHEVLTRQQYLGALLVVLGISLPIFTLL